VMQTRAGADLLLLIRGEFQILLERPRYFCASE